MCLDPWLKELLLLLISFSIQLVITFFLVETLLTILVLLELHGCTQFVSQKLPRSRNYYACKFSPPYHSACISPGVGTTRASTFASTLAPVALYYRYVYTHLLRLPAILHWLWRIPRRLCCFLHRLCCSSCWSWWHTRNDQKQHDGYFSEPAGRSCIGKWN